MSLINKNISQNFYLYSLIALSFSIPIHNRLTSSIVVIIGLFFFAFVHIHIYFRQDLQDFMDILHYSSTAF